MVKKKEIVSELYLSDQSKTLNIFLCVHHYNDVTLLYISQ